MALFSAMSTIQERVVFKQVVQFVENNGQHYPGNHGSSSKNSAGITLIEKYDTLIDSKTIQFGSLKEELPSEVSKWSQTYLCLESGSILNKSCSDDKIIS